jgi:outer membrane protein TolC
MPYLRERTIKIKIRQNLIEGYEDLVKMIFFRLLIILVFKILLFTSSFVQADTLQDVFKRVVKNNPNLKSQRANQQLLIHRRDKSKATLLPRLDLSASYFDSNNDNADLVEYKLLLTQTIFNGALWERVAQADLNKKAGLWQYYAELQKLFITIASIYTEALISQGDLKLVKASLQLSEKNHQIAKKSYELGEKGYLELLKSEADLAQSQVDLINENITYQNSLEKINVYLKKDPKVLDMEVFSLSDFVNKRAKSIKNHRKSFYDLNAEIQAFHYRIQAVKKETEAARWEYWPNLTFTIEAGRKEGGSEFTGETTAFEELKYGLQLNWNLFQGWGTDAAVNESIINQKQLMYQLEQAVQDLEHEFYQLENNLRQGEQKIHSLEIVRAARNKFLQVAQRSWELGEVNLSEVLAQRVELFKVEELLGREIHMKNLNQLKIYQLLGKINPVTYLGDGYKR